MNQDESAKRQIDKQMVVANVEFNIENKCPFCMGTMRVYFYKIPEKEGYYVLFDCVKCKANMVGNEYVKNIKKVPGWWRKGDIEGFRDSLGAGKKILTMPESKPASDKLPDGYWDDEHHGEDEE